MTNKTDGLGEASAKILGLLVFIVIALAWGAGWSAYTLSVLWGWFVVPLFGLPALSIAQAFGLALVVRSANGISAQSDESKDDVGTAIMKLFFLPLLLSGLILLFGWVAKAWV